MKVLLGEGVNGMRKCEGRDEMNETYGGETNSTDDWVVLNMWDGERLEYEWVDDRRGEGNLIRLMMHCENLLVVVAVSIFM